jgi:VanZ family protein
VRRSRALLWAPFALLLAYEFYLSSQSVLPAPPSVFEGIPQLDKVAHATYYFLMGAMAVRAARFGEGWSRRATAIGVVIFGLVYGALDEFHQSFVPHRDVELGDVIADTVGCALAAMFAERLWVRSGLERSAAAD